MFTDQKLYTQIRNCKLVNVVKLRKRGGRNPGCCAWATLVVTLAPLGYVHMSRDSRDFLPGPCHSFSIFCFVILQKVRVIFQKLCSSTNGEIQM